MSTMRGTVEAACSSGSEVVGGGITLGAGTRQDESLSWGGDDVVGGTTFGESTKTAVFSGVALGCEGKVSELRGRL